MFLSLNSKKKIIGYGASTKGNVVLSHCEVKNNQIQEICDGSKRKLSKFTPGTNIKTISKELMRKKNPDYLLVRFFLIRNLLTFLKIDIFCLRSLHHLHLKN